MYAEKICLSTLLTLSLLISESVQQGETHYIHWNASNALFRGHSDRVIDVALFQRRTDFDQANLICPFYPERNAANDIEQYVIYRVSKRDYDECRVDDSSSKMVAVCDSPFTLTYVTLTFRAFNPTPGGLEFAPDRDYYFISTSSKRNLWQKRGGSCRSHNMRLIFRTFKGGESRRRATTTEKAPIYAQEPKRHLRVNNEAATSLASTSAALLPCLLTAALLATR